MSIVDGLACKERVPFHQLLLELIQRVNSVPELNFLEPFVFKGEILKDHEHIAEAWKGKCMRFGKDSLGENGATSLHTHSRDIAEKKKAILEEARRLVEDIVNLSRD